MDKDRTIIPQIDLPADTDMRPRTVPAHSLPVELWRRCWEEAPDRACLKKLSLVCSLFRDIGQALIFRHLHFTGYAQRGTQPPGKRALRRNRDRLRALQLSPLRAHVRTVVLQGWTAVHNHSEVWELSQQLFWTIGAMYNLYSAKCTDVLFKTESIQLLMGQARQTGLRTLALHDCRVPWNDSLYHRPRDVSLHESHDFFEVIGSVGAAFAVNASSLLSPVHLVTLEIHMPFTVAKLLPTLCQTPPFSALSRLTLTMPPKGPCHWLGLFLNRCTALTALSLIDHGDPALPSLRSLSRSAMPQLAYVSGPPDIFEVIVPSRPIVGFRLPFLTKIKLPPMEVLSQRRRGLKYAVYNSPRRIDDLQKTLAVFRNLDNRKAAACKVRSIRLDLVVADASEKLEVESELRALFHNLQDLLWEGSTSDCSDSGFRAICG